MMPKRKGYYAPHNFKKGKFNVTPGLKGFICTCNTYNEKECIRESYNLLNEYSSKFSDEQKVPEEKPKEIEEEVEDELEREIKELKPDAKNEERKFNVVGTDVKGVVFIKTTIDNPVKITHSILSDIAETKQQRTRFLMRMIPVEVVCKATVTEIKAAAVQLFRNHFKTDPTTFAILFNRRQSDSMDRMEIVKELALLVTDCNPLHQANLKEPNLAVIVEVMRGICCLSVVPDYFKLKKYNLLELACPTNSGVKSGDKNGIEHDKTNNDAEGKQENVSNENPGPEGSSEENSSTRPEDSTTKNDEDKISNENSSSADCEKKTEENSTSKAKENLPDGGNADKNESEN